MSLNISVKDIAKQIRGIISGDKDFIIKGICSIEAGKPGHLSYIKDKNYYQYLNKTTASILIVDKKINITNASKDKIFIIVDNPGKAFIKIIESIKYSLIFKNEVRKYKYKQNPYPGFRKNIFYKWGFSERF